MFAQVLMLRDKGIVPRPQQEAKQPAVQPTTEAESKTGELPKPIEPVLPGLIIPKPVQDFLQSAKEKGLLPMVLQSALTSSGINIDKLDF